jgi:radical SAM protein with 4Fe4S-binding SPASM domain
MIRANILLNQGKMSLPRMLIFEPTLRCNLDCVMCDRDKKKLIEKRKEMELDDIKIMIENLPKTINTIYISGGEPFVRKDIYDICKLFLDEFNTKVKILIQTNGMFVSRVLRLTELKRVSFNLSIDGPRNIHNMMRGDNTSFDNVMNLFKLLILKGKIISTTTVISEYNLKHVVKLLEYIRDEDIKPSVMIIEYERKFSKGIIEDSAEVLGLNTDHFPVTIHKDVIPSYSFQVLRKQLEEIDKTLKTNGFKFFYLPSDLKQKTRDYYYRKKNKNPMYCYNLSVLRVDPYGDVIPCFTIRKKFGNILKTPFVDIWNSREFRMFRQKLIKNNLAPVCEACFAKSTPIYTGLL